MKRIELLILPHCHPLSVSEAVGRLLGTTLDAPGVRQSRAGNCTITIAFDQLRDSMPLSSVPSLQLETEIIEGRWPEPVGLRIQSGASGWTVQSDTLGVRPIYYGHLSNNDMIVSTRPDVIAALINATLSTTSLVEQLLVGFHLDTHTAFEGVYRLRPTERITCDAQGNTHIESIAAPRTGAPASSRARMLDTVTPIVCEALASGAALELSGGVDSRLVLAIGLCAGVQPAQAFTLGDASSADVHVAQQLCRRFDIPHMTIQPMANDSRLDRDGCDFVSRAGFAVNTCSYAWLPQAFDTLSAVRTAQIGGGGGECATGFYYTPLDWMCTLGSTVQRAWIRKRLFHSGISLGSLFDPSSVRDLTCGVVDTAAQLLSRDMNTWRSGTDSFYRTQRVANAGGPVLSASACWYEPVQPLLHSAYIAWGQTLTTTERRNRAAQRLLIAELVPDLVDIPFARDLQRNNTGAGRDLLSKAQKFMDRLSGRPAHSDLGAAQVAQTLARNADVQQSLHQLIDSTGLPWAPAIADSCTNGALAGDPHTLGCLLTAAWAHETVAALQSEMDSAHDGRTFRRAA